MTHGLSRKNVLRLPHEAIELFRSRDAYRHTVRGFRSHVTHDGRRARCASLLSPDPVLGPACRWLQRRRARANPIAAPITMPATVAPRMTRAKGASNCQKRNETVVAWPFWRAPTATITATTVRTIRKGMRHLAYDCPSIVFPESLGGSSGF